MRKIIGSMIIVVGSGFGAVSLGMRYETPLPRLTDEMSSLVAKIASEEAESTEIQKTLNEIQDPAVLRDTVYVIFRVSHDGVYRRANKDGEFSFNHGENRIEWSDEDDSLLPLQRSVQANWNGGGWGGWVWGNGQAVRFPDDFGGARKAQVSLNYMKSQIARSREIAAQALLGMRDKGLTPLFQAYTQTKDAALLSFIQKMPARSYYAAHETVGERNRSEKRIYQFVGEAYLEKAKAVGDLDNPQRLDFGF